MAVLDRGTILKIGMPSPSLPLFPARLAKLIKKMGMMAKQGRRAIHISTQVSALWIGLRELLLKAEAKLGAVWVWGLPLAPFTMMQTLDAIEEQIKLGKPSYLITANLHYAMLTSKDPRLVAVNERAAFLVADGMPFVWASRYKSGRLPERVTGADLVPRLCERAAAKGYRIFLLGAAPGVAEQAGANLTRRFPGLQVVGTFAPPFRDPTQEEHAALVARIRSAQPHILLVAFGQPKGEIWVADHYLELGVPVCIQVGGSLDFAAGRISRAPRWVQRLGIEWFYRMVQEPRRLAGRYVSNAFFLMQMLLADLVGVFWKRGPRTARG